MGPHNEYLFNPYILPFFPKHIYFWPCLIFVLIFYMLNYEFRYDTQLLWQFLWYFFFQYNNTMDMAWFYEAPFRQKPYKKIGILFLNYLILQMKFLGFMQGNFTSQKNKFSWWINSWRHITPNIEILVEIIPTYQGDVVLFFMHKLWRLYGAKRIIKKIKRRCDVFENTRREKRITP